MSQNIVLFLTNERENFLGFMWFEFILKLFSSVTACDDVESATAHYNQNVI